MVGGVGLGLHGWHYYIGWWAWAFLITAMNILTCGSGRRQILQGCQYPLGIGTGGLALLALTFTAVPFTGTGFIGARLVEISVLSWLFPVLSYAGIVYHP